MKAHEVVIIAFASAFLSVPVVVFTGWWWACPLMVVAALFGQKAFEFGDKGLLEVKDRWFGWRLRRDMKRESKP
jgi:hypothetical protein